MHRNLYTFFFLIAITVFLAFCNTCKKLNGKIFKVKDMMPGKNAPPMHPRCHCCTAPHWDEAKFQAYLREENRKMHQRDGTKRVAENSRHGIMNIGIITGALDPMSPRAEKHAVQYYESVRHMKTDTNRIAKNTGWKKEQIDEIKEHIFIKEHDLLDGHRRFAPSFEMAQSWQRLIDGKSIKECDRILLQHEHLELTLMKQGYSQNEAHILASKKYNYASALEQE